MRKIPLLVLMIVGVLSSLAHADYIFNPDNGHYYGLTTGVLPWDLAEAEAISQGGHLASITTQAEQDFLVNNFVSNAVPGGDRQPFWIGANDQANEGVFTWTTGEAFLYNNWNPGEPNNQGDEDFVAFNFHYGFNQSNDKGTWNDTTLTGSVAPNPYRGIIELDFNPTAVPEPSSCLLLGIAISLVVRIRVARTPRNCRQIQ